MNIICHEKTIFAFTVLSWNKRLWFYQETNDFALKQNPVHLKASASKNKLVLKCFLLQIAFIITWFPCPWKRALCDSSKRIALILFILDCCGKDSKILSSCFSIQSILRQTLLDNTKNVFDMVQIWTFFYNGKCLSAYVNLTRSDFQTILSRIFEFGEHFSLNMLRKYWIRKIF